MHKRCLLCTEIVIIHQWHYVMEYIIYYDFILCKLLNIIISVLHLIFIWENEVGMDEGGIKLLYSQTC